MSIENPDKILSEHEMTQQLYDSLVESGDDSPYSLEYRRNLESELSRTSNESELEEKLKI